MIGCHLSNYHYNFFNIERAFCSGTQRNTEQNELKINIMGKVGHLEISPLFVGD